MNTADEAIDAVAAWTRGHSWLVREITARSLGGRLDGLLVPIGQKAMCMKPRNVPMRFFDRCRLIAVEVKMYRSDFNTGLREGQFGRYAEAPAIAGVYIVAPKGVCEAHELPEGIGLLRLIENSYINGQAYRVRCQKHPALRDVIPSAELLWRILFKAHEQMVAHYYRQTAEQEQRLRHALGVVGRRAFPLILDGLRMENEK